ncbi:hypothetical protein [Hyalangium rubrum]|uniref:Uncharacterized protein n=1 Tax=Hyalangium rubrum TaxID=3103134 RepID=A0ABU5GW63_9BACT|nr:hypothetical protein [Hyalangium sp. s54d21]MDY7225084.1 hypothetical protein [Hyalangium sp. s54d21]
MDSEPSSSPQFFVLKVPAPGNYDTEFSDGGDHNVGEAPRCPRCSAVLGMLSWLPPYRGELELHGESFGDLVRAPGNELLMNERMAEAFQREGLKGLSGFHPVEIVRVRKRGQRNKPPVPPKYLCVSPAFLSAAVDETRSRIRRSEPFSCTYCRAVGVDAMYGFALEEGSWNGDDIFRPRGSTGRFVVSQRFEQFVTQHGFTNMQLTPTQEFIQDYSAPNGSN